MLVRPQRDRRGGTRSQRAIGRQPPDGFGMEPVARVRRDEQIALRPVRQPQGITIGAGGQRGHGIQSQPPRDHDPEGRRVGRQCGRAPRVPRRRESPHLRTRRGRCRARRRLRLGLQRRSSQTDPHGEHGGKGPSDQIPPGIFRAAMAGPHTGKLSAHDCPRRRLPVSIAASALLSAARRSGSPG